MNDGNTVVVAESKSPLELESQLIAQEHRSWYVLANLYKYWRYPQNDPRQSATMSAFFWLIVSLFLPGSSGGGNLILTLGGIVLSFLACLVAYWSYGELTRQNELISEQNRVMEATRISQNVSPLIANLLADIDLEIAGSNGKTPQRLSPRLNNRLAVLARQCLPYRVSREEGVVLSLSPERGHLLTNLAIRNVDISQVKSLLFDYADMQNCYLPEVGMPGVSLRESNCDGAYLYKVDLRNSDLWGASLRDADLAEADLSGADIQGADFSRSVLVRSRFIGTRADLATNFYNSNVGHSLDGLVVNDSKWLSKLSQRPPSGFSLAEWELVINDATSDDGFKFTVKRKSGGTP